MDICVQNRIKQICFSNVFYLFFILKLNYVQNKFIVPKMLIIDRRGQVKINI